MGKYSVKNLTRCGGVNGLIGRAIVCDLLLRLLAIGNYHKLLNIVQLIAALILYVRSLPDQSMLLRLDSE